MTSKKDYTKYILEGEKYSKRGLVLAIINKYVESHKDISYDKLKEIFPDNLQAETGTQFSKVRVVFSKKDEIKPSDQERFFLKEEEIIQIKDCKIAVSGEWNHQNIQNIIGASKKLGYIINENK